MWVEIKESQEFTKSGHVMDHETTWRKVRNTVISYAQLDWKDLLKVPVPVDFYSTTKSVGIQGELKTNSAQHSSNTCKNYLLKNYS